MPDAIGQLTALRRLHLGNNQLAGTCAMIRELVISRLSLVRDHALLHFARCRNLCGGFLVGAGIPDAIGQLTCLEWLDVSKNHLKGKHVPIHASSIVVQRRCGVLLARSARLCARCMLKDTCFVLLVGCVGCQVFPAQPVGLQDCRNCTSATTNS